MTEEAEKRMQERMEALAAQVESLRSELRAVREQAANRDSVDFGGGGEPDWSGAMGKVPDGMVENPAIPPLPDTTAAKDPNRTQYKSIDDRAQDNAPPGVTQIHDFDETLLSNTRRIQLKAVTTTGTGGGRKLRLVDPDGNADFQTKWMVPLREAGTGGREIKWACIGGEVDGPEDGCSPTVDLTDLPGTTGHPNGGVRITVTPCEGTATNKDVWNGADGAPGHSGCSPVITKLDNYTDLPLPIRQQIPEVDSEGRTFAYALQIISGQTWDGTRCSGGSISYFPVYNGKPGADGCTPTVTAGTTPSEHGTAALYITPCGSSTAIPVYNGKDGNDGAGVSGTFLTGLLSLAVTSDGLTLTAATATYTDGVRTATGTTSATVEKTTC